MHYIMNKDTPVIEIETAKILNTDMSPYALKLMSLDVNKIYKWLVHRALPLNRKNSEKIYKAMRLSRDNQEIELMYLTHSLSINDNYWVASTKEINKIDYNSISLFKNSFNKAMYLVALRGDEGFTISEKDISAEYTGQGTFPKCFIRESDGVYLYKSGNIDAIRNEIYAGYIAEILGAKTVHYEYSNLEGINCTKSKIYTNEKINWESAFIISEFLNQYKMTPQQFAETHMKEDYTSMIILDAIILNDDRHMKNWSIEIEADTNKIIGLAPNYDYNNAFKATSKTMSNLKFNGYRTINILQAARQAYYENGTTLRLSYLYQVLNSLNIPINKESMKNRIDYIVGKRDTQRDCY